MRTEKCDKTGKKRYSCGRVFLFSLLSAAVLGAGFFPEAAFGAEGYEKVAKSASHLDVGKYGMLPVYGRDILDGTYDVEAESSSSFFRIQNARLTAKDGELTVSMQIPSTSYEYVYMGSGEDAGAAALEDYIAPKVKDGISEFTIPVEALDKKLVCSAFSKNRKKWYERTVVFDADSLPAESLKVTLPDYDRIEEALALYDEKNGTDSHKELEEKTASENSKETADGTEEDLNEADASSLEPVSSDKKDGTYSIQVSLTGGSGRASVSSPTWLIIKDHKAYARLLWSSSYYDYMIVGGKKFYNESEEGGNSTFTIPITAMDVPMQVIGDTTAMGDPIEIEYKLTFYEGSIGTRSQIPQEAAITVLIVALIIIGAGGVLNFFLKKRKKR